MNCLFNMLPFEEIVKDKNGNIIGSKGLLQDYLFYITDKLNVTIRIIESTSAEMKLQDNGSWNGEIGFLQRKEVDVVSTGLGINVQRSDFIDFPISIYSKKIDLTAVIPKGISPNMWVYVSVFGFNQWMFFVVSLLFIVMGLTVIHTLLDDHTGRGISLSM